MNADRRNKIGICAATVVAAFVVCVSMWSGMFSGYERLAEDRLVGVRAVDPRLVILAIDDEAIQNIGRWPWDRSVWAQIVRRLSESNASAVGLDVMFSEASPDDEVLANELRLSMVPIVLATRAVLDVTHGVVAKNVTSPLRIFFGQNISVGAVNVIPDPDSVVRSFPAYISTNDGKIETMAFAVLRGAGVDIPHYDGISRIVYSGSASSIRTISLSRLLDDSVDLDNKIVFVGATATDLHDEQRTPLSRGTLMSGVEIQTQIAAMALRGDILRTIPYSLNCIIILFLCLTVGLLFAYIARMVRAIIVTLLLAAVSLVLIIVSFDAGWIVPPIYALLAILFSASAAILYKYAIVDKERRNIRHAFQKYVSPEVLADIMRNPAGVKLGGEVKNTTILFSDVRGFTTFSEEMTPSALVQFLNRYLSRMTAVIMDNRGVVDKYIGDAIMAFWGAPLTQDDHAMNAIRTALKMKKELGNFNSESLGRGDRAINIGVGLNSGQVVAGNMGSEMRFDYTLMGDAVNLASRLESLTKLYGITILASENTISAAGGVNALAEGGVHVLEVDRIMVKGKKEPITVYDVREDEKESDTIFKDGLREYYAGNFGVAVAMFEKVIAYGPAKLLLARSAEYQKNPPAVWNGVYEMKTK